VPANLVGLMGGANTNLFPIEGVGFTTPRMEALWTARPTECSKSPVVGVATIAEVGSAAVKARRPAAAFHLEALLRSAIDHPLVSASRLLSTHGREGSGT
jgi:hypothetical protein